MPKLCSLTEYSHKTVCLISMPFSMPYPLFNTYRLVTQSI